jgi:hypothetical protein
MAEARKLGDLTVNDGKGLYDNEGVCDTLLVDLNRLPKILMDGQYIQFCAVIQSMAQRIKNLKEGIRNDTDSLKNNIETLKRANDELMQEKQAERDGVNNDN